MNKPFAITLGLGSAVLALTSVMQIYRDYQGIQFAKEMPSVVASIDSALKLDKIPCQYFFTLEAALTDALTKAPYEYMAQKAKEKAAFLFENCEEESRFFQVNAKEELKGMHDDLEMISRDAHPIGQGATYVFDSMFLGASLLGIGAALKIYRRKGNKK